MALGCTFSPGGGVAIDFGVAVPLVVGVGPPFVEVEAEREAVGAGTGVGTGTEVGMPVAGASGPCPTMPFDSASAVERANDGFDW